MSRRWPVTASVVGVVLCAAAVVSYWPPAPETLLAEAQTALLQGDFDRAEQLALQVKSGQNLFASSRFIAGEAATKARHYERAIHSYATIPRDDSETAVRAAVFQGEVLRETGQLSAAEHEFHYVLQRDPGRLTVQERIAFLMCFTGRRWEALPHLRRLLDAGRASVDTLIMLGDYERPIADPDYLKRCRQNAGDDVLVQLAVVSEQLSHGKKLGAVPTLKAILQQRPGLISTQALLGELLVEKSAEFSRWHARLPDEASQHPDIWLARGLFARHQGNLPVATRCFWETVRRAPSHRRGNYQLGQVLKITQTTGADEFIQRASQLARLTQQFNTLLTSRGQDMETLRAIVTILKKTGRIVEARAWLHFATSRVKSAWPLELLESLPDVSVNSPFVLESANLTRTFDFSDLPDHQQALADISVQSVDSPGTTSTTSIRFQAETDCGIDFVYNNGQDPSTKGGRMFEQAGGGASVLDFDGDNRPDLYLTQGGLWKTGETSATPHKKFFDRIFRNCDGRRFIDVTQETGIHCLGFGQGSTAGDFNEDGFPDIYVSNVGANQLLMNNGDGTFSDVTQLSGLKSRVWTSSCTIVDLNADGLSDLFDVNYLTDNDVFTRICDGLGCSPKHFRGEPDMVHINQGDGSFTSISVIEMRAGVTDGLPRDSGLGVIAADIHQRGRPSLFITNDGVPNLFLKNTPSENSRNIRLEDSGFLSGLAFNEDGLAMACMGIAAGDVNGDQRLDFFVTNFRDEPNTLYIQDANGLFSDATSQYGLEFPSMSNIGWGTQFLDADLDGDPDLVLVNSDVDDLRDEGGGFGMLPQLFQNTGGYFDELRAEDAGPFFGTNLAGRGLATLDWNADGRMDFAVSVILDPAVIVTNTTTGGHFLNLEVRATRTARDAIGTTIEVTAGPKTWTRTLVAGDGYMACNQRLLQFGLGASTTVDHVRVTWPSGTVTTIDHLPADSTLRLVESYPTGTLRNGQELRSLTVNSRSGREVQASLPNR